MFCFYDNQSRCIREPQEFLLGEIEMSVQDTTIGLNCIDNSLLPRRSRQASLCLASSFAVCETWFLVVNFLFLLFCCVYDRKVCYIRGLCRLLLLLHSPRIVFQSRIHPRGWRHAVQSRTHPRGWRHAVQSRIFPWIVAHEKWIFLMYHVQMQIYLLQFYPDQDHWSWPCRPDQCRIHRAERNSSYWLVKMHKLSELRIWLDPGKVK